MVCSNCQCSSAFFFVFDLLFNLFRIALWPSVRKELSPWRFTCAVFIFYAVLTVCVLFPVWCLGQDVKFDFLVIAFLSTLTFFVKISIKFAPIPHGSNTENARSMKAGQRNEK